MHAAPATRYEGVFLRAWDCRSCAGDAQATWAAVQQQRRHLRLDATHGWLGRIEPSGTLVELAVAAARRPAAVLVGGRPPAFACSASKGDIAALETALDHGQAVPWSHIAPDTPTMAVARALGIRHLLPVPIVAACSTGLATLLAGADLVAAGYCDEGLVAVADRSCTPLILAGFEALGVACGQRDPAISGHGFAIAEGAAAIALGRQGPWRLVAGVRLGEASHETRCGDPGVLAAACAALWAALPEPDMIVVHGTGTPAGDVFEASALAAGPWSTAPQIRCKPWIGHALGASGLIELTAALQAPARRLWKLGLGFGGHVVAVAVEHV